MKKSLIALAVLGAFAGVAHAQSSVTVYGQLDIAIGKRSGTKYGINNTTGSGGLNSPSYFGLRGVEDLGGGTTAFFNLQTGGLDLSTGGTTVSFTREAHVGLGGGFGEVRLGRTSSIAAKATGAFDLNGVSGASALANAGISPVVWYGSSRRSDQIQYATPNMGGFQALLGYTFKGDNTTSVPALNKARTSLGLKYGAGPLALGFATESADGSTGSRTASAFNASYDFGAAMVSAGYVKSPYAQSAPGVWQVETGKGYHFGVAAPLGAFTLGAQLAKNTESDAKALELWARYNLSKRTRLYVDYGKTSGVTIGSPKQIGAGVYHSF